MRPFGDLRLMNLRCREAACLISASMDRRLTRMERIGLWIHLRLCGMCRRYQRAARMLRALMKRAWRAGITEEGLSQAARGRIRERLMRQ